MMPRIIDTAIAIPQMHLNMRLVVNLGLSMYYIYIYTYMYIYIHVLFVVACVSAETSASGISSLKSSQVTHSMHTPQVFAVGHGTCDSCCSPVCSFHDGHMSKSQ